MLDALRAIGVVARALDSIANIEFRDLNLTRGQYLYLVRIVEQPGIIQEQLVNQLKVDRATVARSVAKLTDQGLVTKRPDPANAKANRLYPTAAGQAAYVPIHQENAYSLHQALAGMSPAEVQTLERLLNQMCANVDHDWQLVKRGGHRDYSQGATPMTNPQIIPVTVAQIPQLVQLARTTFADTFNANTAPADMAAFLDTAYSPAALTAELNTPGTTFWFITVNGTVAGYLKLNVDAAVTADVKATNALELERIYILPAYKHQGLGSRLYDHALHMAQRLHKDTIALGVWEHNEPAKAFYAKRGFHKVGAHAFVVGSDPQRDWLMEASVE